MKTLVELAQAIESGKKFESYSVRCPWGDLLADTPASSIVALWEDKRLRLVPELKPIDLSVLIESGIDCEFSDDETSDFGYRIGILNSITPSRYLGKVDGLAGCLAYDRCKPRMGDHWHNWQGGECPLPEGLKIEIMYRGGSTWGRTIYSGGIWEHVGAISDIIAFRVLGKADTHCWPWE